MSTLIITLNSRQTIPGLNVSVQVDDVVFPVIENHHEFAINYNPTTIKPHTFKIVVDGKKQLLQKLYNNKIDLDVPSMAFIIESIKFNDLDVTPFLQHLAKYTHDTNGDTDTIIENYTDWLGADGVLNFDFKTPIFTWLLKDFEF
jgi:hypothetical protein